MQTVGQLAHDDAVRRLKASYDDLATTAPIRLAKCTSNLFHQRSTLTAPGLDVSGLAGVISIDLESGAAEPRSAKPTNSQVKLKTGAELGAMSCPVPRRHSH